jgi:gliding motility-associated-like protein
MDDLTRERYMYMANANSAMVSPVGAVWRYIRKNYPSIGLYDPDGSHPSAAGSYAAACTFYTTIFRKDPRLVTYNYTLSSSDADEIKNAAKLVVLDSLSTWHIGQYDPDTQPPTVPNNLSAGSITETSFTLSWTASSDNVGVTGYDVYKNGTFFSTVTGTSVNVTGLNPSTTYTMSVKAKDAAGNISAASSGFNITTIDTHAPSIPTGLTASIITENSFTLNWAASTDNVGVTGYDVYRNGTLVYSTAGTTANITGLNPSVTYSMTVSAKDAANNVSSVSSSLNVTTIDTHPPSVPTGLAANSLTETSFTLTWIPSTDNAGVTGYDVYQNGSLVASVAGTTANISGLSVSTTYSMSVKAKDAAGNISAASNPLNVTTPDTHAPSVPTGLTASSVTQTSFTLTWTASSDNVGVTGYEVYRDGTLITTVTIASANITGLSASTTYAMTVKAKDAAGNASAPSSALNVTTEVQITTPLTITGVTANNKVYDGTTAATLNTGSASLSGVISGDVVTLITLGATGTFVSKNAGTGKTVSTSGFTLGGADAGKYSLTQPTAVANISTAVLTVSGVQANNKVYNGNTTATLNTGSSSLSGVFGSDVVTLVSTGATGTFSDRYAGTGKAVTIIGLTLGGTDSGNYTLTQPTATANITAAVLTVSGVTAGNKIYDGTTTAVLNTGSASLTGVYGSDNVNLVSTGVTGSFSSKIAGTSKVVTASGFSISGSDAGNYTITQPTTTANITKATLTVTGVTANNRVYNGTTSATLNTGSAGLSGVIGGDAVSLVTTGATGTFNNKNAGIGKPVSTAGFTLGGTDSGNYTLTQPTATAGITTAGLTVSGVTANKVYDGTTAAILNTSGATLTGVYGSDAVTLVTAGATGSFSNRNVGTGKTVNTTGFTLGGTDAVNYTVTQPVLTGNITAAGLMVSGVTANNKVYDGTTTATLNLGSLELAGGMGGDDVTLVTTGATGSFVNKNTGTGKTVSTSGFSIGGTDSGNYTLTQPTTSANISPSVLTVSGVTANNKVYDGTTAATLNAGSAVLSGVIGGDAVSLVSTGATGIFNNKNTGTGKPVTTTGFTTGGTDAGNYTITQPTATGNITASGLTVTGVTVNNKVYDGTTTATLNTVSASLGGVFGTDAVTLITTGATGTFNNKNAGTGKTVTTTGFTIGGSDAVNYTLTQPVITGTITGIVVTVTGITAASKAYDGTTTATINSGGGSLSGVTGTDAVTLITTGATGTFNNKNAGTGKTVSTTGFTLGGADAGNYTLTQPTATANITTAVLTVSGVTANNKVYDGTTAATLNTVSSTFAGLFGSDAVTLVSTGATGTFSDNKAGTHKAVTISGLTLGGSDAVNYTLTQPTSTANITTAVLTVSGVTANNKIYDGSTTAQLNTGSAVLTGVVAGDAVSLVTTGSSGTFVNKNAGTNKSVTITGFSIGGIDVTNYTVTQPTVMATITPAPLTISGVTANNKVYNGTTPATLSTAGAVLSGVVPGDAVTLITSGATGSFVNKNAGTGKTVLITGFTAGGPDYGNYTITQPTATANITTAVLTVSGVTANSKVYDGTTTATLNTGTATLSGVFGTDVVTLNATGATGAFDNKNAGTGKTVFTSGFTLGGTDGLNYTIIQPSLLADLTPKSVTITANDLIKHYQTTLTFTGTEYTAVGLSAGDPAPVFTISSAGAQAAAVVGKYVITIGGGTDNNYQFTYVNGTMTVGKSPLIVTADSKTKVYGSANPVLSITYSGFFKNDDASVLDSDPVVSTAAQSTSDAGSYAITLSGGSDNNYDLTLVNGNLEIQKAPLTITAEDKTKVYKEANPELTMTYSGFVLGQDQSVLDAQPEAETDATTDSDAGSYDINITGASAKNYSITYNKGKLSIDKADQTITFGDIPSGLRMTQTYDLNATASSGLNVTYGLSDPEIASLDGNILTIRRDGSLTVTAMQEGDQNWNAATGISHTIETLPTFDGISSLFTPNNDGMNDYWYIPDLEQYGKLEVTVYNRFGQAVYKSDSYKNDWDGTWNGYPLPSATYYYIIKSSVKGYIKGVVNIVR